MCSKVELQMVTILIYSLVYLNNKYGDFDEGLHSSLVAKNCNFWSGLQNIKFLLLLI